MNADEARPVADRRQVTALDQVADVFSVLWSSAATSGMVRSGVGGLLVIYSRGATVMGLILPHVLVLPSETCSAQR